jgi:hypothetical protein
VKRGERRGSRTVRVCGSKKSRQTQLRRPDALLYVFECSGAINGKGKGGQIFGCDCVVGEASGL